MASVTHSFIISQHFSDDEDSIAENASAAVVVDEELEDSRLASELPEPNADEGDGDENDVEGDAQPTTKDGTDPATVSALKSLDALDPTDEAKATKAQDLDAAAAEVLISDSVGDGLTAAPSTVVDADPDVLPLGDEILMPTPATQIMPEPAPDGPSLGEISDEQLLADAAAFAASAPDGLLPVDDDGVIPDDAMEFAIGEP